MRVLWFVNIPLPPVRAMQGLAPLPGGGWLSAGLDALVAKDPSIEVVCASRSWPAPEPFVAGRVRHVTVPDGPPVSGWGAVRSNWLGEPHDVGLEDALRALLAEVHPDLIHVHGTESAHARALMRVAGRIPVLVSVQGSVTECAARFFQGLTAGDVLRDVATTDFLKGRGLVHTWRRMRIAARREAETLSRATDVCGRTDWDREFVARANPSARYRHIDEALRAPFYRTAWRGPSDGEQAIVCVTSAAPYKGIDVLLEAFATIRSRRPCTLRVIGQVRGTDLWPSLRRREGRLGLTGSVEWVGEQDADQVADALATCAVAVCPSRVDNSPNSVCEAMLMGVPVAASRAGGIPSLITNEQDGLLFATGDVRALADALCRVMDDPQLAGGLGKAARVTGIARNDPSTVAGDMLGAYLALTSDGRG